jgi:outer membrane protein assembly factor BamB
MHTPRTTPRQRRQRRSTQLRTGALALASALALATQAPAQTIEDERLIWFLDMDSPSSGRWTAVAPDGTIYATDDNKLYAVNPDGSLQWDLADAGSGEDVSVGLNGTIYSGAPGTAQTDDLVAVDPSGKLLWRVELPEILVNGPSVGPDGNVYGAVNQINADFGAFSFDPSGNLLWTNPGDPEIKSSNDDWSAEFVAGRVLTGIITSSSQGSVIHAFFLNGVEDWYGSNLPHNVYGKPVIHPDGSVVTRSFDDGIEATAPDGSLLWQREAPTPALNWYGIPPVISPDGTIYVEGNFGDLWAVDARGGTVFYSDFAGGIYQCMGVSPDGGLVLLAGSTPGSTGYVQAFDTDDGAPLWQVNIPKQNGFNTFVHSARFTFSPDGRTAYATTQVGGFLGAGRLIALDLSGEGRPVTYCTAGTSASGCQAQLASTGTPSASAGSGFTLKATGVEGSKDGLFFYGTSGRQANPWGNGTSFQCVVPPLTRADLQSRSGTDGLCDGSFAQDLNAFWSSSPSKSPGAGALVQAQLWYRDPLNTSNQTTSFSEALEFAVAP